MLRELDSKSSSSPTYKKNEAPFGPSEAEIGRNIKQIGHVGAFIGEYSSVFVLGLVIILVPVGLFENFHIIFPNLSTAAVDDRKCHRDLFAFHRCAPFYFFYGDVKKTNSSHRIPRNNDICINSISGFGG